MQGRVKALMFSGGCLAAWFSLIRVFEKDTWFHLAVGRHITHEGFPTTNTFSSLFPDHPWKNTEWLFDLLIYAFYQGGGMPGVQLLQAVLVSGAFLCVLWIAVRRLQVREPYQLLTVLLLFLLFLSLCRFRFPVRPHLVTYLGMALLMLLWEVQPRYLYLWAGILGMVWANCHAGVVFGFVLCVMLTFSTVLEGDLPAARKAGLTCLTFFGASLLNPFHLYPYLFAFIHLNLDGGLPGLEEFRAYNPFTDGWTLVVTGLLTLAAVPGALKRRDLFFPLTSLTFLVLSLFAMREIPAYAIVAFPGTALFAANLLDPGSLKDRGVNTPGLVLLLGLVCTLVLVQADWRRYGDQLRPGVGVNQTYLPAGGVEYIREKDLDGVMYNDYGLGGYLMWKLYPRLGVFQDGRATAYPASFLKKVSGSDSPLDPPAWDRLMERFGCRFGIVGRNPFKGDPGVAVLFESLGWPLVYLDGTSAVYVRPGSENERRTAGDRFELVSLTAGPRDLYDRGRETPADMIRELERIEVSSLLVPLDAFRFAAGALGAGDSSLMERFLVRMWQMEGADYDPAVVARQLDQLRKGS